MNEQSIIEILVCPKNIDGSIYFFFYTDRKRIISREYSHYFSKPVLIRCFIDYGVNKTSRLQNKTSQQKFNKASKQGRAMQRFAMQRFTSIAYTMIYEEYKQVDHLQQNSYERRNIIRHPLMPKLYLGNGRGAKLNSCFIY